MLVLIPTAGIGSRLDFNTRYMNKSLLQMGDLPVLSRIIESYPLKTKFIIALGYKGDHIKEYLNLVYPNKKITFVKVKNYKGRGSGLTLTLRNCLKKINKPFFFHANDTIFNDKSYHKNVRVDTMYIHKGPSDTMKYATVQMANGQNKINYKLNYQKKNCYNYTGVAFIKNFTLFKKLVKNDKENRGELTYFKKIDQNKIDFKFVSSWFDIGDKEKKTKAENFFLKKNILPKYDQAIFFKDKRVIKFFVNKNIINKRLKRAKILQKYVPKILKYGRYFYVYKFVDGKILSTVHDKKVFTFFLNWLVNNFWKIKKLSKNKKIIFKERCFDFYYEKTLSRISLLFERNNLDDKDEIINGIKIPRISDLLTRIDWKELTNGIPSNFHGDLHLENICINKKKITLLDWREDFSQISDYGDIYYDLAKINHGFIIDHKIIKNSKYSIDIGKTNIRFKFYQEEKNRMFQKIFFRFLKKHNFSEEKVKILTSLIYLNISPLHHYPYSFFLYYLGKYTLFQSLNKK